MVIRLSGLVAGMVLFVMTGILMKQQRGLSEQLSVELSLMKIQFIIPALPLLQKNLHLLISLIQFVSSMPHLSLNRKAKRCFLLFLKAVIKTGVSGTNKISGIMV